MSNDQYSLEVLRKHSPTAMRMAEEAYVTFRAAMGVPEFPFESETPREQLAWLASVPL